MRFFGYILHLLMHHTLHLTLWNLSLIIILGAKKGKGVCPEENQQCLARELHQGDCYRFFGQSRVNLLREGREATIGKEG